MNTENDRVKELRKTLGLTLEEFGTRVGVTRMSISKIETGKNSLTTQMCTAICREFNVNEKWLREGSGEIFKSDLNDELDILADKHHLSKTEKALVKNFVNLKDNERKFLLDFFMKIADEAMKEDSTLSAERINEMTAEHIQKYRDMPEQ